MKLSKGLLWVAALIFVGIGVLYTFAPEMIIPIAENPAASASARTEIRAVYGGIELGLGIFFALSARREDLRVAGLAAAALVSGCAGLARYSSFFFEGGLDTLQLAFGASELVGGLFAAYVLRRELRAKDA